jgi:hypothetical protein
MYAFIYPGPGFEGGGFKTRSYKLRRNLLKYATPKSGIWVLHIYHDGDSGYGTAREVVTVGKYGE